MHPRSIIPGVLGILSSLLGAVFAALSTSDYAAHLDRQLHDTHCSFIPGLDTPTADNPCEAAMYSPYSAVLKSTFWGGVPISLFGLGAFAFFLAFSIYLVMARADASKRFRLGFFLCTVGPLVASIVMFVLSLTKLGALCKLCVGIYLASLGLFVSGMLAVMGGRKTFGIAADAPGPKPPTSADADATVVDPTPWHQSGKNTRTSAKSTASDLLRPAEADPKRGVTRAVEPPTGSALAVIGLPALLGLSVALPGLVYATALPNYEPKVKSCGTLEVATEKHDALVKIPTKNPKATAVFFEDPLCPTCKAFHERLVGEGIYEQLDVTVAIFPLDSECNWMLSRPMHPGACVLARAFLCGEKTNESRAILEWSYEHQEELTALGKESSDKVRAKVVGKFAGVDKCIDSAETKKRLDHVLQFAVANKLRISTPQLFLDGQRMCDEDTDLGLPYAMTVLAPKVKP